jgi:hypothetical protein
MFLILNRIFILSLILFFNTVYAKDLDASGVVHAYQQWCQSIGKAKGNSKEMTQYYASRAILLPTLSDKILFNEGHELDDYFTMLTSYKDIHCVTQKLITLREGENFATSAGFYQFIFIDKSGKTITLPARFTFVYEKQGKEWLIVQHHSSKMPTTH